VVDTVEFSDKDRWGWSHVLGELVGYDANGGECTNTARLVGQRLKKCSLMCCGQDATLIEMNGRELHQRRRRQRKRARSNQSE
jgi:hypothetical protein